MRYFRHLSPAKERLFHRLPEPFDRRVQREELAHCLGATLYTPADRRGIGRLVFDTPHVASVILCLEDALGDEHVADAEASLLDELTFLREMIVIPEKSDLFETKRFS